MKRGILETIGETPLIEVNLNKRGSRILAKLEFLNPGGSIKDRMALYMVKMAEKRGYLKPGTTIIEATSGNTGIAFSMIASVKGYKMIAVIPENMSLERQQLIKAFGARVVLTSADKGPRGAIEKRNQLAKEVRNAWIPDQFENINNVIAHKETTAREIVKQIDSKIDAFVAGVGTGGTLMGVAQALREANPGVMIVAVEPAESAIMSGGDIGNHNIQGIGEGFIPKLVNLEIISQIETVVSKEAELMSKRLVLEQGILAGISSGANMAASLRIAKKLGEDKTIVTVLPDRGERYFSQGIFN